MNPTFPCPCCGFLVFDEPAGSYATCPLCGWEDDPIQLQAPGYAGGANKESLCELRRCGGWDSLQSDLLHGYRRAPDWRPLRDEECRAELPLTGPEQVNRHIYYWAFRDLRAN